MYEFTVFASDKSEQSRSSSAIVRVSVTNVNDETPEFSNHQMEIYVDENAPIGSVVIIIQAVDMDGDGVTYYFSRMLICLLIHRICVMYICMYVCVCVCVCMYVFMYVCINGFTEN